jgi:NTE family protein
MLVRRKPIWRGRKTVRRITLALQGGGALGGFVWGVLDRLLMDSRIEVEGISGTSSGAINAALFADGMAEGGPAAAQDRLEGFWHAIAEACEARRRPWFSIRKQLRERRLNLSSLNVFYDVMHRLMIPYAFDPKTMEPLRSVIAKSINFERLNAATAPKLFINATDIGTASMRIFTRPLVSVDALCASSCLPMLFDPVEIDGAYYWDGGFMGNPALTPLVYGCKSPDILLVQTEPSGPRPPPRTAAQLIERMSEISFTATLAREIDAIALQEGVTDGDLARKPKMPKTHLHMIQPDRDLEAEGGAGYSKFNAEWAYITHLRDLGRAAADEWLDAAFERIGRATTADLENRFA